MKKWIWLAAALLLALGAYVAAGPYLTIRAIQQAVQEDDTRALARQVDFPALRSSLKLQLDDYLVRSAGADAQGSAFGQLGLRIASGLAGGAVDAMVTPVGLAAMMEGRRVWRRVDVRALPQPAGEPAAKPLQDAERRYESPSRFTATVHDDAGRPVVFVLTRDGLHWRLSDIRLPL
ncbi:DUF2939 domain-containing protein [Luteimonas sp. R10]|uniref:DUF2939 domain-containing protein n=1 Tax=Luteimonas sp. R10 TaxID=3108176 RepID=UPI0030905019|nr:DUF2939 domain-containing protein [Luteimonas sp. R10]